jgi:hypothetical protein
MPLSIAERRTRYRAAHPERVQDSNARYRLTEKGRRARTRYVASTRGILSNERYSQRRNRGDTSVRED